MKKTALERSTFALALTLLCTLLVLSIRGVLDPGAAARAFGLPVEDAAASFYHAVYRDRNLVLAVIGLVFLWCREWRSLAIVATASVSLPLYDIAALMGHDVPVVALHWITLGGLTVLSVMLWAVVHRTR